MSVLCKISTISITIFILLTSTAIQAVEGRYQAHWNGKSYLILDSENGHIWTFEGDAMTYSGRVDGKDFIPSESTNAWKRDHGRWQRQK